MTDSKKYRFVDLMLSKASAVHPFVDSHFDPNTFTNSPLNDSNEVGAACLCQEIKWVWKLSQVMAVNPLSVQCECDGGQQSSLNNEFFSRPKLDKTKAIKCKLAKVRFSFAFINAVCCLLLFMGFGCVSRKIVDPVIKTIFMGTDAYAFKLHVSFRILQTIVVLSCGLGFNRFLIRTWESIQQVVRVLNHKFSSKFTLIVRMVAIGAIILGLSNVLYTVFMGTRLCFVDDIGLRKVVRMKELGPMKEHARTCLEFGVVKYILFVWALACSEYVHITLASLLFVITLAMRSLHNALAKLLENTLYVSYQKMNPNMWELYTDSNLVTNEKGGRGHGLEQELERLRLLYENLCETVIHMRRFFGVSALFICCDGILTCVFGIYWKIIYNENLRDEDGDGADIHHYIHFSLHFAYSAYSVLLILISGQILAVSALEAPKVIRKARISHLPSSARFQVTLLLQVSSAFPTKLSVLSITNLEMPFLAAAATNVITYLLVLMQFRLQTTTQ